MQVEVRLMVMTQMGDPQLGATRQEMVVVGPDPVENMTRCEDALTAALLDAQQSMTKQFASARAEEQVHGAGAVERMLDVLGQVSPQARVGQIDATELCEALLAAAMGHT